MSFLPLFTLRATHQYYANGACSDFDFVLAEHSRRALQGTHLLARIQAGRLHILFEGDANKLPLQNIAGVELLIGLRLKNPCFEYFTEAQPVHFPLYCNTGETLDSPQAADLVSHDFTPDLITQRPLTLSLMRGNTLLWRAEIQDGEAIPTLDMRNREPGVYRVTQQSGNELQTRPLILAPDLAEQGMWGAVNILVTPQRWISPPDFQIRFGARTETLNYYVVAPLLWPDFEQLSISGNSVSFEKFGQDEFPANSLSPALLGAPDVQSVLFRSSLPIARRAVQSPPIQLTRNGDTLINNLPRPGADMHPARFIIQLSKP